MAILHAPKLRAVLIPADEDPGIPGGKHVKFRHTDYVAYPHDYSTTMQLRGRCTCRPRPHCWSFCPRILGCLLRKPHVRIPDPYGV